MTIGVFEQMKQLVDGKEVWMARQFATILGYKEWRNFLNVISKAKTSCRNSGQPVDQNFTPKDTFVPTTRWTMRKIADVQLSRYACYLILQNADPGKEIVAQGQTYFALQTRNQEMVQHSNQYLEDQKRVILREEVKQHNKKLASTAKQAGVTDYAEFADHGYMGLYGGMRHKDIHELKKLEDEAKLLDYMNSEELGANLFRATQTEALLKREAVEGQAEANQLHFMVGKKVRDTIQELGWTMPEQLPVGESIAVIKQRLKQQQYQQPALSGQTDAQPLAETGVPTFPIPEDIQLLQRLKSIISDHPGLLEVRIGHQRYALSPAWMQALTELFTK